MSATHQTPPITYLDHAASAPVLPEVVATVAHHLATDGANPSAAHGPGRAARRVVDDARDTLGKVLGVEPGEIIWTSGGTEADNLAIFGLGVSSAGGRHLDPGVVCSAVEHAAVLEPTQRLRGRTVAVDRRGVIDLDALAHTVDERTTLVSVMAINNEVGVVQPIAAVADVVRSRAPAASFHVDAVQALAWLDLAAVTAVADAVSVSAHKVGGPQGVGALWVRKGVALAARHLGGGQERGRRSGTVPVALVAGAAVAADIAAHRRDDAVSRVSTLRDALAVGIAARIDGVSETGVVDGDRRHLAAGHLHLRVDGVEGEALRYLLDEAGICVSAGAACSSGAAAPSHVLEAMGVVDDGTAAAVRVTFGHASTDADVDRVLEVLPAVVSRLRRTGS